MRRAESNPQLSPSQPKRKTVLIPARNRMAPKEQSCPGIDGAIMESLASDVHGLEIHESPLEEPTKRGARIKKLFARTPPSRPHAIQRSTTVPIARDLADFCLHPPPLRLDAWSEEPAANFKVRSPTYLADQLKMSSEEAVFKLLTVDLIKVHQPIFTGLCAQPNERIQMALQREKETGHKELPDFVFAVNLVVPGKETYHAVFYFGVEDKTVLQDCETPFGRLASQFFFGPSDDFRRQTFKLIPRIAEGNVVVRKAVGSKPTILGKKIQQHYIREERFFELIVDIGSEKVAQRIVKLALGYAKNLVVDMMFVLEGKHIMHLPERILGGVRMQNIDFKDKDGQRVLN